MHTFSCSHCFSRCMHLYSAFLMPPLLLCATRLPVRMLCATSLPKHAFLCAAGLAGAWIGLTIQHCGNHGAMSTSPAVNKAMGLTDDLIGGSSLMWRYHHQASVCIYTCLHSAFSMLPPECSQFGSKPNHTACAHCSVVSFAAMLATFQWLHVVFGDFKHLSLQDAFILLNMFLHISSVRDT